MPVASFKTSDKNNSTFSTFDQRFRLTGFAQTTTDAAFSIDEPVIQASTNATGIVHSINTGAGASVLTITNKKGNLVLFRALNIPEGEKIKIITKSYW